MMNYPRPLQSSWCKRRISSNHQFFIIKEEKEGWMQDPHFLLDIVAEPI